MQEFWESSGQIIAIFLGAILASWAITTLGYRLKRSASPRPNAAVRVRASNGVFRSRFLGANKDGWELAPPLHRGSHVPLKRGDALTVELPSEEGIMLFRTKVVLREPDPYRLVIEAPKEAKVRNRRDAKRIDGNGLIAQLEGEPATLVNVSSGGAAFRVDRAIPRGERVWVNLPGFTEPIAGWIVGNDDGLVRVVFEERIELKHWINGQAKAH